MEAFRNAARFLAHRAREAALYPQLLRRRSGRTLLLFPCMGREMSSLLRVYEIADGLAARGWTAVVVPKQLDMAQRQRLLRLFRPDICLLQKSRHALNSHELLRGHRYVYDLDDADFHDPKLTGRMERDVAESVGVIAGSRYIARWCRQFQPNTRIVWTCARPIQVARPDHRNRAPTIVWAQSQPEGYPAEFEFVTGVMEALARRRKGVRLRLYGDGAAGESDHVARLEAAGVTVEWVPFMEYGAFVRSLCDMSVGLAPLRPQAAFSRGKSFGKILAYLDAGVPVIASDEVDNALLFEPGSGVVSNDPEVWVAEIDRLLDAPEIRNEMSRKADRIYRQRLSVDVAVDLVEAFLLDCLDRETPSG